MALREKSVEKVVIKTGRRKKTSHVPHGGWKVAYADFVTAMMAFFLLMWLVSSTDENQREVISDYFNPYQSEDDSQQVEVNAGIISIMDGGKLSGEQIESRELQDSQGSTESAAQAEDIKGEEIFASPLEYWDIVELPREKYDDLMSSVLSGEDRALFNDEISDLAINLNKLKDSIPILQQYSDNIIIEEVFEGLRVQFIDQDEFTMFRSGSASMTDKALEMIANFGIVLKEIPNKIAISGHTDGVPFSANRGYSNWELSSDRANAARRAVIAAGVSPSQIERVEGKADMDLLFPTSPKDPRNRRIEFMILR